MTAILLQMALGAAAAYLGYTGDAQGAIVCAVGSVVIMALRPRQ